MAITVFIINGCINMGDQLLKTDYSRVINDLRSLAVITPLAAGTRETDGDNLALSSVLQHYIDAMRQGERQTKKNTK